MKQGRDKKLSLDAESRRRRLEVSIANGGALKKFLHFICCVFTGIHLAGGAIVLTGARIIDGTGLAPLENGALILEGNRILNVGAADMVQRPPGAEVIEVNGKQ